MSLGGVFQQAFSLTGSFSLWLILIIFLLALVAEFGFSIPYLFETIWVLVGYSINGGSLNPPEIGLYCFISLVGRLIGAGLLYKISGISSIPLARIFKKLHFLQTDENTAGNCLKNFVLARPVKLLSGLLLPLAQGKSGTECHGIAAVQRILCPTPLSVALGRFCWLKIPITITLGLDRKLITLLLGVALFSLAWDSLYILIGVFGAGSKISPLVLLAGTFSAFIILQIVTFSIRRRRMLKEKFEVPNLKFEINSNLEFTNPEQDRSKST